MRSANPDSISRYRVSDDKILSAYLEKWQDIRSERVEREARYRRMPKSTLELAVKHRWPGLAELEPKKG